MPSEPRKLVTLQRITKVARLKGRYKPYDVVTVGGGWTVIIYHNDFAIHDLVIYFEIDSFIPETGGRFTWQQGDKMTEFRGEKGYHVRSQMLGKQISQGLVQAIGALPDIKTLLENLTKKHGEKEALGLIQKMRLDDIVGVKKWEVDFEANGKVLGRVPTFFHRPACDRVQNIPGLFTTSKYRHAVFQITEKLDGVSMTVYRVEVGSKWHKALPDLPADNNQEKAGVRIGVASAGEDLDERGNDVYWQAAKHFDLLTKINDTGLPKNVAVQGELIGPTIKNNSLKFADEEPHDFIIFQIFDIDKQCFISPIKVLELCARLRLPHVPVLGYFPLRNFAINLQDILAKAEGVGSQGQTREGFVLKCMSDEYAFKVISNKWLLEQGE